MTGQALHIQDLTVHHGAVTAVSGATLSAAPGEVTCLLGMNGAGKSSLLRAIVGLSTATGRIELSGRDIAGLSTEDRIRAGIAYVPEGRRVFPGLTVAENLLVAGPARSALRNDRLAEVFALFPQLAQRPTDRAWQLSGGQQQMLAIGRALMAAPDVYLLDEPSLGLAPGVIEDVAESLAALTKTGAAILVAEQNASFAERIADRTIMIHTGRITPGNGEPAGD